MSSIDNDSTSPQVHEPLYVLTSPEMSAATADVEFLLQVEAVHCHEVARAAQAKEEAGSSANHIPFPMPHELAMRSPKLPNLLKHLQPLYDKLGTWEVSSTNASEAIAARRAIPLDLGVALTQFPTNASDIECGLRLAQFQANASEIEEDAAHQAQELDKWHQILAVKEHERSVWGCFDSSPFPEPINIDGTSVLVLSTLRSEVHADDSEIITTIAETGFAWDVLPESVVNAVPMDDFEVQASGGFCLRSSDEPQQFESAMPHEEWLCVICLDEGLDDAITVTCGHIFHRPCISLWFRKSKLCPLCRCKCRSDSGPALSLPPLVFDLEPWPMLPAGVVEQDIPTSTQERIVAARAGKSLSIGRMEARRKQLADRFKCQVPSAAFLEESIVLTKAMIGPASVFARIAWDLKEAARIHDQLDEEGSQITSWPVGGRWPGLAMTPFNQAALARLTRKRNRSRLEVQCRTPRGMARHILNQHYKRTLFKQSQSVIAALCSDSVAGAKLDARGVAANEAVPCLCMASTPLHVHGLDAPEASCMTYALACCYNCSHLDYTDLGRQPRPNSTAL